MTTKQHMKLETSALVEITRGKVFRENGNQPVQAVVLTVYGHPHERRDVEVRCAKGVAIVPQHDLRVVQGTGIPGKAGHKNRLEMPEATLKAIMEERAAKTAALSTVHVTTVAPNPSKQSNDRIGQRNPQNRGRRRKRSGGSREAA